MLNVFFSIHNPPFSALRGFDTSLNESTSRGAGSPNLVLRGFHNLRLISLREEFLLKTDSGYPKDTGLNKPWQPLGIPSAITLISQFHQSPLSSILDRVFSHPRTKSW